MTRHRIAARRAAARRRRHGSSKRAVPAAPTAAERREVERRRADRQIGRGRLRQALRGYLGLAAETPDDLAMLNCAGDVSIRAGQLARGVELFLRVGRGYRDAGFAGKAIAVYRKVLRLVPEHSEAYRELNRLYRRRGLTAEAWTVTTESACRRAQSGSRS